MTAVKDALSGRPFTVSAEVLAMNWGGRRDGSGLACGFCNRIPVPGDMSVFVMGRGAPNTFACWDCCVAHCMPEAPTSSWRSVAWTKRWREDIAPILRRWSGYFAEVRS